MPNVMKAGALLPKPIVLTPTNLLVRTTDFVPFLLTPCVMSVSCFSCEKKKAQTFWFTLEPFQFIGSVPGRTLKPSASPLFPLLLDW